MVEIRTTAYIFENWRIGMHDFRQEHPAFQQVVTIDKIYKQYAATIYTHVHILVWNQADAFDITQESFVDYLSFVSRGGVVRHPLALLYKISSRHAIRHLRQASIRKKKMETMMPLDEFTENLPFESWTAFKTLFSRLDAKGKVVLKALLVDEMTVDEIVEYAGISKTTVKRRIRKIRSLSEGNESFSFQDGPISSPDTTILGKGEK